MFSHKHASFGYPARTYINQLRVDTGYSLEDLPGAMDNEDKMARESQGILSYKHNMMKATL